MEAVYEADLIDVERQGNLALRKKMKKLTDNSDFKV
jgi:hypothetical protein